MDGTLPITRHFFKVMMPGFLAKASIPPAFCRKLKEERLDEAILTSCKGSWTVKIGKGSKGNIYFEEGWDIFVQQHCLSLGDFVVFEHTGNLHFNTYVFGPNACEKDFSSNLENEEKRAPAGVNSPDHVKGEIPLKASPSYGTGCSHFVSTITASNGSCHNPYMNVPVEFSRSNNLRQISSIILRDPSGKSWPVAIRSIGRGPRCKRTHLTNGWLEFYKSNKLKEGDVCIFELNGSAGSSGTFMMDVQIFPYQPK
ncbi:unnamed protein product [Ilex paraguariensis]|uniref:TF-B3 domain-containing protein n=1 Tax=Ilex paraguariensis TaxID=185542 RepID=A0ABC8UEV1_9AQUA